MNKFDENLNRSTFQICLRLAQTDNMLANISTNKHVGPVCSRPFSVGKKLLFRYLDFRALFEVVGVYTFPKMGVKDAQYEKAFKELFEYNFALIFSQIGFEVSKLIIRKKSFSYS